MDAGLFSELAADVKNLQALTGETVTIGSTNYTCTIVEKPVAGLVFEQGGATSGQSLVVAVRQIDLATPPAINSYATFRGIQYRVHQTHDLTTTWSLLLIQGFA